MIRNLKIQCPKCHSRSELYLSTHAPIVILNCPNCWTPMLYNESAVYVLSQRQIHEIVKNREFSIDNLLEKVAHCDVSDTKHAKVKLQRNSSPASATHEYIRGISRKNISADDILDLRIELETCKDSLEFINRL